MAENTNTGTNSKALTTLSTLTHGEAAITLDSLGTLDGVTTHGEAVTVRPNATGTRVDVIVTGAKGQLYVENKPRPTGVTHPKLTVNGKARKNKSYERGAFPSHVGGKNTAARSIATAKLTDATITMTTGDIVTLEGVWTVMAMVKTLANGRLLRSTHVIKGESPVVKFVNG